MKHYDNFGGTMADDSEEKSRGIQYDFATKTSAIIQRYREIQKMREEQLEEFRNKQYLEQEILLPNNEKQGGLFIGAKYPYSENKPNRIVPEISDISLTSLENDLDSHDTLQESSITGHLQRCFNDSSPSNVSLSESKVPIVSEKVPDFSVLRNSQFSEKIGSERESRSVLVKDDVPKPKRPFLKKGSGLLRYMPKSKANGLVTRKKELPKNISPVKNFQLPQKTLKLKPAIRKTDTPSENVKHIRFDIAESDNGEDFTENDSSPISKISGNTEVNTDGQIKSSSSPLSPADSFSETTKLEDGSVSEIGNLNLLKENEELKEFEMLEDFTQNYSFNSDSSVVQRIFESNKTDSRQNCGAKITSMNSVAKASNEAPKRLPEKLNFFEKIGLNQHIEEIQARKQNIQKTISDIEPQIISLQKEISCSKKDVLNDEVTDQCNTLVQDLDISSTAPECKFENGSSEFETSAALPGLSVDDCKNTNCQFNCKCCNADGVLKNLYLNTDTVENSCSEEEEFSDVSEKSQEKLSRKKAGVRETMLELEKEIETYQQLNSKLTSKCKETDELMKKLKRDCENFKKYQETEKKKLEAEIEEERKQMKRQKESFKRLQALSKDNPTKKEREELTALRQEIEKLQEELKRQKIKYSNDSRRWKNKLDAAERDRDCFEFENRRLSEQCEDLITALKSRIKKNSGPRALDDVVEHSTDQNIKEILVKDAQTQTQPKEQDSNISQDQATLNSRDVRKAKPKVNFDITPDWRRNILEVTTDDASNCVRNSSEVDNLPKEHDVTTNKNKKINVEKRSDINLSVISVSVEAEFKEINHVNKKERIYPSGEREIIYNTGTRKIISADGKSTKFLFYNGDVKETFSGEREVYRYVNGVTETQYPDGLKVREFPNGKTERRFPDGQKEVKLPDGTIHNTYADGSIEICCTNGKVETVSVDGTKVTQFPNGQREIWTDTYKRREFPDGSVKVIYNSGKQETRYPDGRVRIKNEKGKVILDTKYDTKLKG